MDLLKELNQFKSDYAASVELLETATNELNQAKASFDTFKAESEAKLAQAALDLQAKQTELDAKLSEIAELQKAVAELKANQKSAEDKSVEIVASLGIAPVKVDNGPQGSGMTKAEAQAAYLAITDPVARGAFWETHKELILG